MPRPSKPFRQTFALPSSPSPRQVSIFSVISHHCSFAALTLLPLLYPINLSLRPTVRILSTHSREKQSWRWRRSSVLATRLGSDAVSSFPRVISLDRPPRTRRRRSTTRWRKNWKETSPLECKSRLRARRFVPFLFSTSWPSLMLPIPVSASKLRTLHEL